MPFKLFVLLFAISCAGHSQSFSSTSNQANKNEVIQADSEISEMQAHNADQHRCQEEERIAKSLKHACAHCSEGYRLESYSTEKIEIGCDPKKVDEKCFVNPVWIGRISSRCGDCGIGYEASYERTATDPIDYSKTYHLDNLLHEKISCEEFYEVLARKKKYCGSCLKSQIDN